VSATPKDGAGCPSTVSLSTGAIIGIAIGALVGGVVVVLLIVIISKYFLAKSSAAQASYAQQINMANLKASHGLASAEL
jgi:hypothetical protein